MVSAVAEAEEGATGTEGPVGEGEEAEAAAGAAVDVAVKDFSASACFPLFGRVGRDEEPVLRALSAGR